MKITKEMKGDEIGVIRLVGDFDSLQCNPFTAEVDDLVGLGVRKISLNLRYLRFINSTALGCLVKTKKTLEARGGDIVIAQPSQFTKSVMTTLGLTDIIKTFNEEEAALDFFKAEPGKSVEIEGENVILFQFQDVDAAEAFGRPFGVGKITNLVEDGLSFSWGEGKNAATSKAAKVFMPGAPMKLKFRLPFYKRSYFFEVSGEVARTAAASDGALAIDATFIEMKPADRKEINQFVSDLRFLKSEIPGSKPGTAPKKAPAKK